MTPPRMTPQYGYILIHLSGEMKARSLSFYVLRVWLALAGFALPANLEAQTIPKFPDSVVCLAGANLTERKSS